jgi:hypothetical protein
VSSGAGSDPHKWPHALPADTSVPRQVAATAAEAALAAGGLNAGASLLDPDGRKENPATAAMRRFAADLEALNPNPTPEQAEYIAAWRRLPDCEEPA